MEKINLKNKAIKVFIIIFLLYIFKNINYDDTDKI
jgi:hypothetical protein